MLLGLDFCGLCMLTGCVCVCLGRVVDLSEVFHFADFPGGWRGWDILIEWCYAHRIED